MILPGHPLLCRLRDATIRVGSPPERFELHVPVFDLAQGARVAIVAPSGSGKSLLLECLALVRPPVAVAEFTLRTRAGRWFDAAAAWRCGARNDLLAHRRGETGFLLQQGGLLPSLSVADNIRLPARIAGRDERHGLDMLEAMGLSALRRRRPAALSGGQRQRVALARAAAARPTLLIADEPTAALDPKAAGQVLGLIGDLVTEGQVGAAVIVTHDGAAAAARGFALLDIAVTADADGGRARLTPWAMAA